MIERERESIDSLTGVTCDTKNLQHVNFFTKYYGGKVI